LAPEQIFKLTLLGGNTLNVKSDGVPRPVQVCVYVVRTSEWAMPLSRDQSTCLDRSSDVNVIHSRRVVLAPLQMNQLTLPIEMGQETWLFIDADYSQRATHQLPQSFLISSTRNQLHAMLNGNELFFYDNAWSKQSGAPTQPLLTASVPQAQPHIATKPVAPIAEPLPTSPSAQPSRRIVSSELKRSAPAIRRVTVHQVINTSSHTIQRQGQGILMDEVDRTLDGRK
jgi:predicted component of type VI protein secretion system